MQSKQMFTNQQSKNKESNSRKLIERIKNKTLDLLYSPDL
jgi:hypothetical protein